MEGGGSNVRYNHLFPSCKGDSPYVDVVFRCPEIRRIAFICSSRSHRGKLLKYAPAAALGESAHVQRIYGSTAGDVLLRVGGTVQPAAVVRI